MRYRNEAEGGGVSPDDDDDDDDDDDQRMWQRYVTQVCMWVVRLAGRVLGCGGGGRIMASPNSGRW